MKPRKKEIDAAWDVHDRRPDEFKCQDEKDWKKKEAHCPNCKKKVKINWREGRPYCSGKKCGENLQVVEFGHSHFNKVCQRMVIKYAEKHPVSRQITIITEVKKVRCTGCFQMRAEHKFKELEGDDSGEKFCPKCHKRKTKRMKYDKKQQAIELARMELLEVEGPNMCKREPKSFGQYIPENTTCQKCMADLRILCGQKRDEQEAKNREVEGIDTGEPDEKIPPIISSPKL